MVHPRSDVRNLTSWGVASNIALMILIGVWGFVWGYSSNQPEHSSAISTAMASIVHLALFAALGFGLGNKQLLGIHAFWGFLLAYILGVWAGDNEVTWLLSYFGLPLAGVAIVPILGLSVGRLMRSDRLQRVESLFSRAIVGVIVQSTVIIGISFFIWSGIAASPDLPHGVDDRYVWVEKVLEFVMLFPILTIVDILLPEHEISVGSFSVGVLINGSIWGVLVGAVVGIIRQKMIRVG